MKTTFYILVLTSVFFCFSCLNKKKIIITPQIEFDVLVNNSDKSVKPWIQNIEGPKRESLVKIIFDAAFSGNFKINDFTYDEISKTVRHNSILTIEQLKAKISPEYFQNVNKIRFREEWKIDEKTLQIEKKIKGLAPIIALYSDSGEFIGNKPLFWIELDSSKKNFGQNKIQIAERIQYDVFIKSPDSLKDWWIDNIEKTDREKLAKLILEKVSSGKIKVYDFPFNTPVKANEIKDMLNPAKTVMLKRSTPPYDLYDTTIVQPITAEKIIKIRFLEEWYIDPSTLEFEKKVLGIAPIRENFSPDGTLRGYTPMFWIYFDKRYPTDDMKM